MYMQPSSLLMCAFAPFKHSLQPPFNLQRIKLNTSLFLLLSLPPPSSCCSTNHPASLWKRWHHPSFLYEHKKIKHLQNSPYTFSPARFSQTTLYSCEYYQYLCPPPENSVALFTTFSSFAALKTAYRWVARLWHQMAAVPSPFLLFPCFPLLCPLVYHRPINCKWFITDR